MNRILIAEDEARIASFLEKGLRGNGFVTAVVSDGVSAYDYARSGEFDLMILDIGLPRIDGFTVLRRLREERVTIPVIILTARDSVADTVAGLEGGADDYLAKPFAYVELRARIQALGRRERAADGVVGASILERGDLRLDLRRQVAEHRGLPLQLTPKELGVLRELLVADGAFRTTTNLLDAVWDDPFDRSTDVVKVVIHGLRRKLGDPDLIETVPGFGYRIR